MGGSLKLSCMDFSPYYGGQKGTWKGREGVVWVGGRGCGCGWTHGRDWRGGVGGWKLETFNVWTFCPPYYGGQKDRWKRRGGVGGTFNVWRAESTWKRL